MSKVEFSFYSKSNFEKVKREKKTVESYQPVFGEVGWNVFFIFDFSNRLIRVNGYNLTSTDSFV